ncbi:MAG: hypothetical protein KDJ16_07860 [Hyphomicrobiales bacterium]|nr:hypothetical protein [Hyphomicrobiales bacterium]
MNWRRSFKIGASAIVLAAALLSGIGSTARAGTCIITFHDYPRWAATHGHGRDPGAFCRSFAASYNNGVCRAVRHEWTRAECDDYRRREAAYVAKKMPGFESWSVIWRR